jgi:hypothetical protein
VKEEMMHRIVQIQPMSGYRIRIRFADGVEGEADFSHLAGKGVFSRWNRPGEFEKVKIGEAGQLEWGEDLDMCPDALYIQITGKSPEDVFPALRRETARA